MSLPTKTKKTDVLRIPKHALALEGASKKIFVIHKHAARRLHYDLRLEVSGVLKSFAVPKGLSLSPEIRRLAVEVPDHALSYGTFEGRIAEGNYGAGEVIVWDVGTYEISGGEKAFYKGMNEGRLTFVLRGSKVQGAYSMVRFYGRRHWLIRKRQDKYASYEDPTLNIHSAVSNKTLPDPVLKPKNKKRTARTLQYSAADIRDAF